MPTALSFTRRRAKARRPRRAFRGQAFAALMWTLLAAVMPARGAIIDRVAAIVGRIVITESDVQREARLEAYFELLPPPEPLSAQSPQYRQVLDRLIRQRLLQHEMEQTRFPSAAEEEAMKELQALQPARADLVSYGLKQQDLLDYARRVLDASRFLELRVNPVDPQRNSASAISRQQVEDYYRNVFLPDQARKGNTAPPLDHVRGQIEKSLQEEKDLDDWLKDLRTRVGVRVIEPEKP